MPKEETYGILLMTCIQTLYLLLKKNPEDVDILLQLKILYHDAPEIFDWLGIEYENN